MRSVLILAFAMAASSQVALARGDSVYDRTTLKWAELERLLVHEGTSARALRSAPRQSSIASATVDGEVYEGHARLDLELEIEVLSDQWTLVPILPAELAVSAATVAAPDGRRGLLARDGSGVSFVADGAGHYRVTLSVEGALVGGVRLRWAPAGLAGGHAHLNVKGAEHASGRTAWRESTHADGTLVVDAALGAAGLELIVSASDAPAGHAGAGLEDLEAITVISLGGRGVTRVSFMASPDESSELIVTLPAGARPWKAWVGATVLPIATSVHSDGLHIPLHRSARVEVAYTFTAPPLGMRGRYTVELPRLALPVRGARWELWLPSGLTYASPQASLPGSPCGLAHTPARTPLSPTGTCLGFAVPVLEPQPTFVEGTYDQRL